MFPNEDACRAYLYAARFPNGFLCPYCGWSGEPYNFQLLQVLRMKRGSGRRLLSFVRERSLGSCADRGYKGIRTPLP